MSVCASPNTTKMRQLWNKLDELEQEEPWLLIGDFKCVFRDEEGSSMKGASSSFQAWVNQRGIVDLGYLGAAFTWSHGVSVETRRSFRLDRALCDDLWRCLFPSVKIKTCHILTVITVPTSFDGGGKVRKAGEEVVQV